MGIECFENEMHLFYFKADISNQTILNLLIFIIESFHGYFGHLRNDFFDFEIK